jgi:pectate lyase
MKKILAAGIVALAIGAMALPASASTQTIDATLGSTLAMTATPSSTVSWGLASTGTNTTSGGSLTVNSNAPYTATVTADKTKMTEWVTGTPGAYASSPKTLATALSVAGSRSAGTAAVAGVGATAVVGTSTTLATGTGLGTDTYDVTLSQPTLITDSGLPSGETYHIVLTYTASAAF